MKRFRFIILSNLMCPILTSSFALGQSSITECADIDNAQARLNCYDRVSENVKELPVVRVPRNRNSEPQPRLDAPLPSTAVQDEFGLDEAKKQKQRESEPDSRSYRVLSAKHNDFTGWTIEFEGGGIWKQVGTESYDIEVGGLYTIQRRSFGSYQLSSSRNNRKIRVSRTE
jgi:hypothetical protein